MFFFFPIVHVLSLFFDGIVEGLVMSKSGDLNHGPLGRTSWCALRSWRKAAEAKRSSGAFIFGKRMGSEQHGFQG